MSYLQTAIANAAIADAAWSHEVAERFPRLANARYLPEGKGEAGSLLRALHDWRTACNAEMHKAFELVRKPAGDLADATHKLFSAYDQLADGNRVSSAAEFKAYCDRYDLDHASMMQEARQRLAYLDTEGAARRDLNAAIRNHREAGARASLRASLAARRGA
ncbi:hypothetical protein MesoLjLc_51170 [Mesorhizobium sp. L-8-10]|uniref:hypothetical protein n=1 Tax=Mesorhizobium sp. L-8-10 TaxID=2744523 RepID=UPI001928C784|nr:hypothetical protein [Mesorhizobium sp. L-8-10]BCH33187.1 hypothetical protein MesoLjLc_51170 [Mesorhizobium sp. L-8-10]